MVNDAGRDCARSEARCAPSPSLLRGRDERSSLLEGWGEGLSQRARLVESPPHPKFVLRSNFDLSPQAGRGEARARTIEKKAGIAPGLISSSSCPALCRASTSCFVKEEVVDGRVIWAKTRFALMPGHDDGETPQFAEARLGGVAGHDLIRVS